MKFLNPVLWAEEIDQLRAENERLKTTLCKYQHIASPEDRKVTRLITEIEKLKAELAEAKKDAGRYREWKYRFREGECELFNALADCATDEEHNAAIDAAMKGK